MIVFITIYLLTIACIYFTLQFLNYLNLRQVVRDDGPKSHLIKKGIPTSGGILLLLPLLIGILMIYFFYYDSKRVALSSIQAHLSLWSASAFLFYWIIGLWDDFTKIHYGKGFSMSFKFSLQLLSGVVLGLTYPGTTDVNLFGWHYDLMGFHPYWCALVFISTANAVNLTDGLDGLVCLPLGVLFISIFMIPHPHFPLYITQLSMIYAGLSFGFLVYNYHPAKVFLGDCGSMSLGAALASIFLILKMEFFLILMGGLFVIETLSVAIQIVWYKLTKKRVFKMAPIHHHFELSGYSETQVIHYLWAFSIISTIFGTICYLAVIY